jgi:hypothetical protein
MVPDRTICATANRKMAFPAPEHEASFVMAIFGFKK